MDKNLSTYWSLIGAGKTTLVGDRKLGKDEYQDFKSEMSSMSKGVLVSFLSTMSASMRLTMSISSAFALKRYPNSIEYNVSSSGYWTHSSPYQVDIDPGL